MTKLAQAVAMGIVFSVMTCCTSGPCFTSLGTACSLPITER
jgi:hypothetical protein